MLPPLAEPTQRRQRVVASVRAAFVITFLFSTLLICNLLQLFSLILWPFSQRAFRAFNRFGANLWWGFCVHTAAYFYGTHIELSGDEIPMREHALLVANHQQMADITFLFFLGESRKRLGDMKWFVKDIVKWVPGVGWGMLFLDCLFVKRDWASDKKSIRATFARIIRGRVPLWLMIFPEGTRITPSKQQRSQLFAERKGMAPLQHVLLPRTRGFAAAVIGLREHLHAVYDVTIGYKEGVPSLMQYIKGYVRVAHVHVRRIAIKDMPEDEKALSLWLHRQWQEKDKLLEYFYEAGEFPQSPAQFIDGALNELPTEFAQAQ